MTVMDILDNFKIFFAQVIDEANALIERGEAKKGTAIISLLAEATKKGASESKFPTESMLIAATHVRDQSTVDTVKQRAANFVESTNEMLQ